MKDLLKRWAELEPKRCQPAGEKNSWILIHNTPCLIDYNPQSEGSEGAMIGQAVQQAAQARGWDWTLWCDLDEHGAYIFTDNGRYEYEAEVSAAEAILTAYLKALEENR